MPLGLQIDNTWANDIVECQNTPSLLIHCPVCGHDYNHIGDALALQGWESRKDDPDEDALEWYGRGDGHAIKMECENGGHKWILYLAFHKGQSFITTAYVPGSGKGS